MALKYCFSRAEGSPSDRTAVLIRKGLGLTRVDSGAREPRLESSFLKSFTCNNNQPFNNQQTIDREVLCNQILLDFPE